MFTPGSKLKFFLSEEAKKSGLTFSPPRALDAGFDLPSLAYVEVPPLSFSLVRTGLHVAIPENWVGLVRDRSSVALRGGITVAGVIDASYRGEIKIAMYNLAGDVLVFECGERIAQLIIVPHFGSIFCEEVERFDLLGETSRGGDGFGSTGRK